MNLAYRIFLGCFLNICLLTLFIPKNARAQAMPYFKIQLTNNTQISSNQLSARKPVIIIVFSPDCGHCQILINDLFAKIERFKNTQIIMATFVPKNEIIAFEKRYHTSGYPNIIVGSDVPSLFFQRFYKLNSTPFTVLYDKNRKMVVSYHDEKIVDNLIKKLQTLPWRILKSKTPKSAFNSKINYLFRFRN